MKNTYYILLTAFLLVSCAENKTNQTNQTTEKTSSVPVFNEDSCFSYVKAQTDFGARVPNNQSHRQCADYLSEKLRMHADTVIVQECLLKAYNGTMLQSKNIIASFNIATKNRIMLCAHWDSRPFCDEETEQTKQKIPVIGANDGASGVAVLLELARIMDSVPTKIGVDIILFDAEDYGVSEVEGSYCLGSQYWAKNLHEINYNPKYGILLDMVGDESAIFCKDAVSAHFAPDVQNKIWKRAAELGYSNLFVDKAVGELIDDHYYINLIAGIPCIDIIHYNPETGFPDTWHTNNDIIDNISKSTLKAVGTVLTTIIYEE